MSVKSLHLSLAFAAIFTCGFAIADEHAKQALKYAKEAASAAGDAKVVGEQAAEALKHIDAAKVEAAKAGDLEAFKQLRKGEADLGSAVKNAGRYNGVTAAQDAKDAANHLDKALGKK
jgi:hypothetical protein